MEYQTCYTITCEPTSRLGNIIEAINKGDHWFEKDGHNDEPCKMLLLHNMWYYHETEMLVISKQFPECVITLHGEGEESGDIWRKYFCNGELQTAKAELVYEPCILQPNPKIVITQAVRAFLLENNFVSAEWIGSCGQLYCVIAGMNKPLKIEDYKSDSQVRTRWSQLVGQLTKEYGNISVEFSV